MRANPSVVAFAALISALLPFTARTAETVAPAPEPSDVARPMTCLVLSGGGARGVAHIGVLKVLDELHVPIDCVVGTSMGAILGGAYALGVSPARMERIVRDADWDIVLSDQPARPERSVRSKELERLRIASAELGLRNGRALLPRGALIGQQLDYFLQSLLGAPLPRSSFDDLPVRFRAIATDIESGRMVVIDHGSVNAAVRASMSVPAVFAPQELEGRLLADGGLVRNLGIDVARSLGAERVIAVNLGTPLLERGELDSLFGVTEQMINILTEQNVATSLAQLGPDDILISPELGNFSSANFAESARTIELGEQAARELAPRLAALALPADAYAARRNRDTRESALPSSATVSVDTSGLRWVDPRVVEARFAASTERSADVSPASIAERTAALYAMDDFQQVTLRTETHDGADRVIVEPQEKSWGPNYLHFGLTLATDFEGGSGFTLLGDYRATWLNRRGLEWRATGSLGEITGLANELRQPLDLAQTWFASASLETAQRIDELFVDDDSLARFRNRALRGSLALGRAFDTAGELRFGYRYSRYNAGRVTGSAPVERVIARAGALEARLTLDRLDSWDFPGRGYFLDAHYEFADRSLGGTVDFERLSIEAQRAFRLGRHRFAFTARYGDSLGTTLPVFEAFELGGFQNLSGLQARQLLANRVIFGRVAYHYRLGDVGTFGREFFVGGSLEAGNVHDRLNGSQDIGTIFASSLFVAADTALGPFYLGVGTAERGDFALYLFLGRP